MDRTDAEPHSHVDELSIDAVIDEPEPAHFHDEPNPSDDELEATELRPVQRDGERRICRVLTPDQPMVKWHDPVRTFWRHQIRISVPHEDCRDHLANERTFLGYLRTSIALSMTGTIIAQLYALQHPLDPSTVFGYFVLGKPLATIFQSAALIVIILGGIRFWRQQSAMSLGKVHAGGFELVGVGVVILALVFMLFVLVVALDIFTDEHEP